MAGAPLEVPIPDRAAAGRALAGLLADHGGPDTRVLALPRGGVPVAYEIAEALESPLDLLLVRKLGVPGHSELAMGAIASGDVRVFNEDILRSLGIGEVAIEAVERREAEELARRERVYRGDRHCHGGDHARRRAGGPPDGRGAGHGGGAGERPGDP